MDDRDAARPDGGTSGETFLSARHPGDEGIADDPAVVFAEDFEVADVAALGARWSQVPTEDAELVASFSGRGLRFASAPGSGTTGRTLFARFENQDLVFVRYYVRYRDGGHYHHTGLWLGGFDPPSDWPMGTAGLRPQGDDFFSDALEPQADGGLDHYAQWPGMDCWMEPGGCYGNNLLVGRRPAFTSDTWMCIELAMRMNEVGRTDGELSTWIDDVLVQHLAPGTPMRRDGVGGWAPSEDGAPFPGLEWRRVPSLAVNWVWLNFYVDDGPSEVGFDQLVIARERVGCMVR